MQLNCAIYMFTKLAHKAITQQLISAVRNYLVKLLYVPSLASLIWLLLPE